jgi:uncharacterized protein (PEP-CTERM system associated)
MLSRRTAYSLYPLCLLILVGPRALAANWTTTAAVAPAVTYTDNLCLSNDDKKGEWIVLLTPEVGVQATGARANLNLNASVEFNDLTNSDLEKQGCNGQQVVGDDRKQYAPRVNGDANAILVENWLYIDASANAYQNQISPFLSGSNDSLNRDGNTNTTYQYNVSPYISRRFKDMAELNLRYRYDDQYNTEDLVGDSSQHSVQLLLDSLSGAGQTNLMWGIQGDYSKANYSGVLNEQDTDSTLKSAQLNLGYQLNRVWQINGFAGDEWNDFVSEANDIDGSFWDVGLRWTPNARTTVDVGNGHRFFGNSPRFAISYRHKRSAFNARYSRDLTYDRNIRSLDQTPPGGIETGPPTNINPGLTTVSDAPILDERFTLGYGYQGRRIGLGVNAFHSEQTRAERGLDATFMGVSATASQRLSQRLSVSCGADWNQQEPRDSRSELINDTEYWSFNFRVRGQVGQNTSLSFDYRYTDRQSEIALDEYTENRFTVTLQVSL